jgi:small subunit ribosomal protein S9
MVEKKKTTTATKKTVAKVTKPKVDKDTVKKVKVEKTAVKKPVSDKKVDTVESTPIVKDVEDSEMVAGKKKAEYLYGVGKRKTAIAQVRVFKKGDGKIIINEKTVKEYCATPSLAEKVVSPLKIVGQQDKLDVSAKVKGGGSTAQAEAVRHGIARALLLLNANFRKPLKKAGYLTRDPRKKERKKPGLKRARKAPQWKKR